MQNSIVRFPISTKYTPFVQFVPKIQNCQFKLKFGIYTNLNMQNSMISFNFFCFQLEVLFLGKFGPKNQYYQFKLKFGTYTNGEFNGGFYLICSRLKIPFLGKFDSKNQNCWFKLKCGTQTNGEINGGVYFIFLLLSLYIYLPLTKKVFQSFRQKKLIEANQNWKNHISI